MREITFSERQKTTVAEYSGAIKRIQEAQAAYLRGVLESHDERDPDATYTVKPDGTALVAVEPSKA